MQSSQHRIPWREVQYKSCSLRHTHTHQLEQKIILIYCILSKAVTVWTIRSCFVRTREKIFILMQSAKDCTSLSSYEVVHRTSNGIADVRYFCGENQVNLTCSVNLTKKVAPYGTCYFASTYGCICSHGMKVLVSLPGNNQHDLSFQKLKRFYPKFCTMKENIDGLELVVGECGANDCIRVPSLDQLRILGTGDEGYIKCLPVYYEVKKKHTGKKQRRILSRGEKEQLRNNRVASL